MKLKIHSRYFIAPDFGPQHFQAMIDGRAENVLKMWSYEMEGAKGHWRWRLGQLPRLAWVFLKFFFSKLFFWYFVALFASAVERDGKTGGEMGADTQ